jgi:hypothetical protein
MFSKVEFQRGLRDTPWLRLKDPAKRGIVDIAVDGVCSIKLRVLKVLKVSNRNSKDQDSLIRVILRRAMS